MMKRTILFSLDSTESGDVGTEAAPIEAAPKIRAFEQKLGGGLKSEELWKRRPNSNGTGALHVRSFHCKLGGDSLTYLDKQINEWLDTHPECEVKFATVAVGEWSGTVREPHMVVQIWV